MGDLQRGVVKWFNDAKGFGFIEHETGRDVFVHYSVIEADGFKTLKDGEEVDYELKEGDKGLHAARVVRTNPPVASKRSSMGEPESTREGAQGVASMIEIERDDSASVERIINEEISSIPASDDMGIETQDDA